MNINQAFPSDYLKAADLGGRPHKLLMGQLTSEKIGNDQRPVLHFQNAGKGLVLNRTNANTIASMYGEETDNWFGQTITLYPDQTDYQGRRVDCIRIQMQYKVQSQPETGMPQPGTLAQSLPPSGLQPSTLAAGGAPVGPIGSEETGDPVDDIPF